MVPLFAKMMDELPVGMHQIPSLGVEIIPGPGPITAANNNDTNLKIAGLVYVDDATTFATNYQQQEKTLQYVNEFAIKHQLEWGEDKCKVMEVGRHKEEKTEWKLGEKTITNCKKYKYLGETISRDGKNIENLSDRFSKIKQTVGSIMTCGKSSIMKRIETQVLLKLHETVTLPTLLSSAETWVLDSTEIAMVNRMELWALKSMFRLPPTTPNPAIIYTTGVLYAEVRVMKKQLLYLHKLLQKEHENWTKQILHVLRENCAGWAKKIEEILEDWGLEQEWSTIATKTKVEWTNEVDMAGERINHEKLKDECHKTERGEKRLKTKTKNLMDKIEDKNYVRKPIDAIFNLSSIETRALIMGRFGMLDCKVNFSKGYGGKMCGECRVLDDESHRINDCLTYRNVNLVDSDDRIDFSMIHSEDEEQIAKVVKVILSMWDLEYGRNSIKVAPVELL